MSDLLNPYIAGAPVVETTMFFGREDVFSWIENSLAGKFVGHILVLHGQRRVGKTSVLKQIPNFLPKQYIQVFFDLQGRTNTTLDRFMWWMASEIVRTLQKEHDIELPRPKRDAFADPDAFINDFIPTLQETLGDRVLLLTFDEFDTLDQPDIQDSLARPLIAFLRRLFDIEGFNFIFSIGSSGNKLENMQAAYTDFFKTALYRKVSFLTKDDCYNLITKPVEGLIEYEKAAIEGIIDYTSGHPYFTQLTCHELFSRCQKTGSRMVTASDVSEILDDVIERGTVNLKFVWDEASDLEKWVLAALAQEAGANLNTLGKTLKAQGVRFSEADLNSAVLHLRDKDVLSKENEFVIQLMKRWLETNRPMDRVREELVQTNPIADRYIEIGDEYRDRQQIKQALDSYQQALDVQPNSLQALFNVASLHQQANDDHLAAEFFLKALQVDDEHIASRQGYSQAQLVIGDAARQAGGETEAIEAYQSILHVNPVHAQARKNLGGIYQQQAKTHLAAGEDQQALESLRQAMEMTPEDEVLAELYQQVIDEKKAALVSSLLKQAKTAQVSGDWETALTALQSAVKLEPDDKSLAAALIETKAAHHQAHLLQLSKEAETAAGQERWPDAVAAWESYLEEEPVAAEQVKDKLDNARKYALLSADYEEAQDFIRNKQFHRAVPVLQGIIAQDPAYKSTLRLLTEAVAASRQRQPIWKKPWAIGGFLGLVLVALGIILFPHIRTGFESVRAVVNSQQVQETHDAETSEALGETALMVTSASDHGIGSLRQALLDAEDRDTIQFDLNIFPPDRPTSIALTEPLPVIHQNNLTIDASDAGVILAGSSLAGGDWVPGIEINGIGNVIKGLQIEDFSGPGIILKGSRNTIGGDRSVGDGPFGEGNFLSGNADGIAILGKNNFITGNLIGSRGTGEDQKGNITAGIFLEGDAGMNLIGPDNIIANNGAGGIELRSVNTYGTNITRNLIYDNRSLGILFNLPDHETGQISHTDGPAILYFDHQTGLVGGQAVENSIIEIFSIEAQGGMVFEGSVTTQEDGNFVYEHGGPLTGPFLTATARFGHLNTSAFALAVPSSAAIWDYSRTQEPIAPLSLGQGYWDFSGEAGIRDGTLFVSNDSAANSNAIRDFESARILVEFDLSLQNAGPEGHCNINYDNREGGEDERWFVTGFFPDGNGNLAASVFPSGQVDLAVTGLLDVSRPNHVQLLILDDLITGFIDGRLAYAARNPNGRVVYRSMNFAANGMVNCEFSNYHVWDLSDFEIQTAYVKRDVIHSPFYQGMQGYMESNPLTFEDDFIPVSDLWYLGWGGDQQLAVADLIQQNQLRIPVTEDELSFSHPYVQASDFILTYELSPQAGFNHLSLFFRILEEGGGYQFAIDDLDGNFRMSKELPNLELRLRDGSLGSLVTDQFYSVTIFAYGQTLAIIFDGELVYYSENAAYQGENISFAMNYGERTGNLEEDSLHFDSIRFWNLDGVDLETILGSTHTPTETITNQTTQVTTAADPWVTEFAEPILTYIADRPPDIEDQFDSVSNDWEKIIGDSDSTISAMDGELFIMNGQYRHRQVTYFDYVVDVNVRMISKGEMGMIFTNGSHTTGQITFNQFGTTEYSFDARNLDYFQSNRISGFYPLFDTYQLRLIVQGPRIALYINSEPVGLMEYDDFLLSRGSFPILSLHSQNGIAAFSDFKVWKITDAEQQ